MITAYCHTHTITGAASRGKRRGSRDTEISWTDTQNSLVIRTCSALLKPNVKQIKMWHVLLSSV